MVFEGWIDMPQHGGKIIVGDRVRFCRLVELSVPKGGNLSIGASSVLSRGCLISCHQSISIGSNVMIAEFVFIHDNDHGFSNTHLPMMEQPISTSEIEIEDDVWLAANCIILKRSRIRSGSIIAAGAIVNRSFSEGSIIGGIPGRVIRTRSPNASGLSGKIPGPPKNH